MAVEFPCTDRFEDRYLNNYLCEIRALYLAKYVLTESREDCFAVFDKSHCNNLFDRRHCASISRRDPEAVDATSDPT